MKVHEMYYGRARNPSSRFYRDQTEAYLAVEIDGQILHAQQMLNNDVPATHPPLEYVMRELRRAVMAEIEKKLFGK